MIEPAAALNRGNPSELQFTTEADQQYTIRPITKADLPAVLEAYRQCEDFLALGPQPHASMPMVLADLKISETEGGIFCGISDPAGVIAGIVDFVPQGFDGQPDHAFLSLLMIAQPYRSHSLGAEVVRTVETYIRRNPAVTAMLSAVQVNNPAAVRFWQRMGYSIVSEPEPQADGTVTVRLWKTLGE